MIENNNLTPEYGFGTEINIPPSYYIEYTLGEKKSAQHYF